MTAGVLPDLTRGQLISRDRRESGWVYRRLGVEPLINCAGVRTNYGGSNPSVDVLRAMEAASGDFVDLDELAEAVGARLAELTGAEWGIVTAGTAAGLALATAACLVGNDPELMLRLPKPEGQRHLVVIPEGQRFPYEHAIRMTGAEILAVADDDHLGAALDTGVVSMICVLGRAASRSPLPLDVLASRVRGRDIPILVDAAGLAPENPDPWLRQGADLVLYSGGKYLRGPQSTGILLGREALCRSAWLNGPPHQAFGRAFKLGKEEIIGAVTAVDRWLAVGMVVERDTWRRRLRAIAEIVERLPGVTTTLLPSSASVTADRLRITWDPGIVPTDSESLRLALLAERPRILLHDFWSTAHSIVVDPFNLTDEGASIAAQAIARGLHRTPPDATPVKAAEVDIAGLWSVSIDYLHGKAAHRFDLVTQSDGRLTGHHRARWTTGQVSGIVNGRTLRLSVRHSGEPMTVYYEFDGRIDRQTMRGTVRVGAAADEHAGPVFKSQFGSAVWAATRPAQ